MPSITKRSRSALSSCDPIPGFSTLHISDYALHLTPEQFAPFQQLTSWVTHPLAPVPFIFVLGAHGTDNSQLMLALIDTFGNSIRVCTSAPRTSLTNASSFHSAFRINVTRLREPFISALDNRTLSFERHAWSSVKLLILEDFSVGFEHILPLISARLSEIMATSLPFGNIPCLCTGHIPLYPDFDLCHVSTYTLTSPVARTQDVELLEMPLDLSHVVLHEKEVVNDGSLIGQE